MCWLVQHEKHNTKVSRPPESRWINNTRHAAVDSTLRSHNKAISPSNLSNAIVIKVIIICVIPVLEF